MAKFRLFPLIIGGLVLAVVPGPCGAAEESGEYHVAQVFKIGGKGSWDYVTVDGRNKLIYVPRTTHTLVVDANSGAVKADITGQKGNHGVAIAPGQPRFY